MAHAKSSDPATPQNLERALGTCRSVIEMCAGAGQRGVLFVASVTFIQKSANFDDFAPNPGKDRDNGGRVKPWYHMTYSGASSIMIGLFGSK